MSNPKTRIPTPFESRLNNLQCVTIEKKKRVTQYFIWASKGGKEREKSWLLVKLFDHQKNALCEKKGENRSMREGKPDTSGRDFLFRNR